MSLNHITIMGRLVRDPELRRTGSGIAVTNFTVAVDRDYNPKDGAEKETDFIDCIAWRASAEFVSKYFSKGQMAIVSGKLRIRNWTDKDGYKRRSAEVEAESVYFGDSKKSDQGNNITHGQFGPQASQNPYAETEAMIAKYTAQGAQHSEFAMLEDDDANLPF
jgi:single-strand DNA-binding protein